MELVYGRTIPTGFRQFTFGYAVTSQASQGLTVDHALLAIDSQSGPVVIRKQFYVSASRGREGLRIYTDDAEALEQQITRSGHRPLALKVIEAARRVEMHPQIAARLLPHPMNVVNAWAHLIAFRSLRCNDLRESLKLPPALRWCALQNPHCASRVVPLRSCGIGEKPDCNGWQHCTAVCVTTVYKAAACSTVRIPGRFSVTLGFSSRSIGLDAQKAALYRGAEKVAGFLEIIQPRALAPFLCGHPFLNLRVCDLVNRSRAKLRFEHAAEHIALNDYISGSAARFFLILTCGLVKELLERGLDQLNTPLRCSYSHCIEYELRMRTRCPACNGATGHLAPHAVMAAFSN